MTAVLGLASVTIGFAWELIYERIQRSHYPAGWHIDEELYPPARWLASIGLLLLMLAVLSAAVQLAWRGFGWLRHRFTSTQI